MTTDLTEIDARAERVRLLVAGIKEREEEIARMRVELEAVAGVFFRPDGDALRDRIVQLVGNRGLTVEEIADRTGVDRREIACALGDLLREGKVKKSGRGASGSRWRAI